jgi:hypothetical protein
MVITLDRLAKLLREGCFKKKPTAEGLFARVHNGSPTDRFDLSIF